MVENLRKNCVCDKNEDYIIRWLFVLEGVGVMSFMLKV